jgi:hypothetical protein
MKRKKDSPLLYTTRRFLQQDGEYFEGSAQPKVEVVQNKKNTCERKNNISYTNILLKNDDLLGKNN